MLVQVAQRVEDLDRAAAFYTMLLGAPPLATFDPPGIAFFALGDTRLMLDVHAPSALLYLGVDDVRERIVTLREAGVPVESDPHVIFSHADATLGPAGTDEWQAFIRDSEGNLVGLVSHLPQEEPASPR
ncbi:MAG: VOC family protein [Thermomicrobiales bacterium]